MLCELCKKREKTRVRYDKYVCDSCFPKQIGVPYIKNQVYIEGYGEVSAARVAEMESQVMLPIEGRGGDDYYVGTRLKSGKVVERTPNFY